MSDVTITKTRSAELLQRMSPEMYREAYERGMTLSALLETEDPSSDHEDDGLDAFQRVLKEAGIRTRSLPEHGIAASTWEDFNRNDQTRALIHEWATREYRGAQRGVRYSTRALYATTDAQTGSWERPWVEAQSPMWDEALSPAIPLSSVIALTTSIDSDAYRTFYLETDEDELSMTRVAEGAEVPRVKLSTGGHVIRLHKYGRSLEATYEQLRRQRVDKIAMHIRRMAIMAEVDKLTDAINVLVNGDGNANTAATSYNLTALDASTTANNLTLKAWLAFKMKFGNPYSATTALTREAIALSLSLLNTGSANVPLVNIATPSGFGYFTPINNTLRDNVALGWTADAPANSILAFDRRFALEMVEEIGGNITEVERYVTRQTQAIVLTEMVGWAVLDGHAARILNLAA